MPESNCWKEDISVKGCNVMCLAAHKYAKGLEFGLLKHFCPQRQALERLALLRKSNVETQAASGEGESRRMPNVSYKLIPFPHFKHGLDYRFSPLLKT